MFEKIYFGDNPSNRDKDFYKNVGITGIVYTIDSGEAIYDSRADLDTFKRLVTPFKGINADCYAAIWSCNNIVTDEKKCHLVDWSDDAGWDVFTRNLKFLNQACKEIGVKGVFLDAENYRTTPNQGGGIMNPKIAWTPSPKVKDRATQYQQALEGLRLGWYVTYNTVRHLQGFGQFFKSMKATALFEDTFTIPNHTDGVSLSNELKNRFGAPAYPGLSVVNGNIGIHQYQRCEGIWMYDWGKQKLNDPLVRTALKKSLEKVS